MIRTLIMQEGWLLAAALYPFVGAWLLLRPRIPAWVINGLLRTGPVPAFIAVIVVAPYTAIELPWLLTGVRLELTGITRIFLLFTSLLWMIAGWYAARYTEHDEHRRRFAFHYLLSFTGNIGLIICADIPGFYASFALMTFAAYGLVVHTQTDEAVRAGRIYIAMAIVGEALILTAMLIIAFTGDTLIIRDAVAQLDDSPYTHWVIGLVLFGFGVKAGLLPLHGWLPLAHPVAPTPASAVLSGSMIKAGLLGWILFLPGGTASYPEWGGLMVLLGLCAAFYAVLIGVTQTNPKTNLAYSSISQMGVMTVCIGIGLAEEADWSTAVLIASIYALNHAFAKGALFLGVGVALSESRTRVMHRRIILLGLGLAAFAVAGAPMTGGALAKRALKYFANTTPHAWSGALEWLLPLTALATTVLLSRLVVLLYRSMFEHGRKPDGHRGLMPAWSVTLLAVALVAWLTIYYLQVPISTDSFTMKDLAKSTLPIAGGLALIGAAYALLKRPIPAVPAGDIVVPLEAGAGWVARVWTQRIVAPLDRRHWTIAPLLNVLIPDRRDDDAVRHFDVRMRRFEVSGAFFVVLIALFVISMMWQ